MGLCLFSIIAENAMCPAVKGYLGTREITKALLFMEQLVSGIIKMDMGRVGKQFSVTNANGAGGTRHLVIGTERIQNLDTRGIT